MTWIVYTYPKDVAKYGSEPLDVPATVAERAIAMRRAVPGHPPICTWCGRFQSACPECVEAGHDCAGACVPEPDPS